MRTEFLFILRILGLSLMGFFFVFFSYAESSITINGTEEFRISLKTF